LRKKFKTVLQSLLVGQFASTKKQNEFQPFDKKVFRGKFRDFFLKKKNSAKFSNPRVHRKIAELGGKKKAWDWVYAGNRLNLDEEPDIPCDNVSSATAYSSATAMDDAENKAQAVLKSFSVATAFSKTETERQKDELDKATSSAAVGIHDKLGRITVQEGEGEENENNENNESSPGKHQVIRQGKDQASSSNSSSSKNNAGTTSNFLTPTTSRNLHDGPNFETPRSSVGPDGHTNGHTNGHADAVPPMEKNTSFASTSSAMKPASASKPFSPATRVMSSSNDTKPHMHAKLPRSSSQSKLKLVTLTRFDFDHSYDPFI
jgi:hypothetical protein